MRSDGGWWSVVGRPWWSWRGEWHGLMGGRSFHRSTVSCAQTALEAAVAAGFNLIVGTDLPDVLNGGGGRDVIIGLAGNDLIDGGGGNDLILSGDDDDVVRGNVGDDTLCLGEGDDFGYGNPNDDRIFGEPGFDHGDGGLGVDGCAADVEVQVSC